MAVATQNDLTQALSRVFAVLSKVRTEATSLSLISGPMGARVQTRLQTAFTIRFDDPVCSTLYEIVLSYGLKAEQVGPGGFDVCIEALLDWWRQGTQSNPKKLLAEFCGSGARVPNRANLQETLEGLVDNKQLSLVLDALELAGFGGRVVVEKSTSQIASLELIRGYTFHIKPAIPVAATLFSPRVACIDGFVESVAELHGVLESTHNAKVPLLLLLRGMADEVASTLRVNYDRGLLRVVPVIVPFDVEGINVLADVAVVAGGDVVSSVKGQLISTLTIDSFSSVPKAAVYPDRIVLVNPTSAGRVASHVKMLRDKRPDNEELGRLIDLRIKSLSPNMVVVRLPDDKRFVIDSQAIDYSMRAVKALVNRGVFSDGRAAAPKLGGLYYAFKCQNVLGSLGGVVTP